MAEKIITSKPEPASLTGMIKSGFIFFILVLSVGANLPAELAARVGVETNFLLGTLYALVAIWMLRNQNILVAIVVLILALGANIPMSSEGGNTGLWQNLAILTLIAVLGVWMGRYVSKILAILFLTVGIGVMLPPDYTARANLHMGILLTVLIALLLTPLLQIIFTRRLRATEAWKLEEKAGDQPRPGQRVKVKDPFRNK
ncbi:MAG: hypothetical protein HQL52_08570 [Magnetococcales bacterium]|nr:hypothetical protein [Magnetococcales bacterium]